MNAAMIEHDRLFLELLSNFFREFVELCLWDITQYINLDSLVFLEVEKELFADLAYWAGSDNYLLAQVEYSQTAESNQEEEDNSSLLILVVHQATPKYNFSEVMYHYFSRLFINYGKKLYPVVLYSNDTPVQFEPNIYERMFLGNGVSLRYPVIQLNLLHWGYFLGQLNPVATAFMAKTPMKQEERPLVKLASWRQLAQLALAPEKQQIVLRFINTYLDLNDQEEAVFQAELAKLELGEREQILNLVKGGQLIST